MVSGPRPPSRVPQDLLELWDMLFGLRRMVLGEDRSVHRGSFLLLRGPYG